MLQHTCSSSQISLWTHFSLLSSKFLLQDLNMQPHFIHIVAFFTLALVASHAAIAPEQYWNSVLPNTPMPKAISDLLQPDYAEEKSTSVNVGKGGVDVNAGKGKPAGGTGVNVGRKGVGVDAGKPGKGTNVGVGKGGVSVNTGNKGKPVYVGVKPGKSPFSYIYAATEDQLHDDPTVALFFLEKDMNPGTTMNLHFNRNTNMAAATILPRQVANSIPFSSNKLPEIFSHFSVKTGSVEAEIMQDTIKECESPGIQGEDKYCATSLESMVDFSTSKLGKNVQAISTEVEGKTQFQKYEITAGVRRMKGEKSVVCHKQNYAYAVFYCHSTQTTNAYIVPLEGADGTKAKVVAVCHRDTSAWNPKHLAFQVLKVMPGTVPICHFLPQDHIVWVPK
ncbi:BURP domain protein RD22-like [Tripterygium wilfordii]|uniref:BURP domain protein RD22-like n=1 Tax=Tripterygium wilfordii TaxID=458696 RepID=UPI0018F83140|nr:BURP domain protein RD22-like [Tripterygium wilfordii]